MSIFDNLIQYLENSSNYRNETKKTYYSRAKTLLKDQNIRTIEDINEKMIIDKLKNRDKNYISQSKNALKALYRANDEFFINNDIEILHENAPKQRKKKEKVLQLAKTNRKINATRNKKFKLAYRLGEITGLRVFEIANLDKNDLTFCDDNRIIVHVRDGKGGKQRKIKSLKDEYLCNELKKLIGETKDNKNLFYCKRYMQNKAKKLNFHIHDLRKVFTQIIKYKSTKGKEETTIMIKKALGHTENSKTHLKYENREINFTGTKYDIK